jgi:hypothetical protein
MRYTARLPMAFAIFTIGCLIAVASSPHLGKQVWSTRVLALPNPFRQPPKIDLQPDSPLLISNARYYWLISISSGISGVLRFEITNRSDKVIHSYDCRYNSPVSVGNGSYGTQLEELLTGQIHNDSISAQEYAPLTLTLDFVQFADGSAWFSSSPQSTVKPDGFRVGAKAAADYLLSVMNENKVQTVIDTLPRIHAEVRDPDFPNMKTEFGIFSFYCGVTNMAVRVEHEYKSGGAQGVERFLRAYSEQGLS